LQKLNLRLATHCAGVAILVLLSQPVKAIEDFRNTWQSIYPESNSDDITSGDGCQLCHQNADGMEPWNPYGWEIRSEYRRNGFLIEEAIRSVEFFNDDSDPIGATSRDEILADFQPGWTVGPVNTVTMADGTEIGNQPPPTIPNTTALDFPTAVTDPIPSIVPGAISIQLHEVAGGFNAPVKAVRSHGIDGSLFVVEQKGKIFRVDLLSGDKTLFHDVGSDLVSLSTTGNDERGLLGVAFHPQFANNGLFYTYQSEPVREHQDASVDFSTVAPDRLPQHRSMIVEYRADDPSCNSRIVKQDTLIIVDQPQGNHNGGDIAFDSSGYLFIALGDGGGANDQGPGHGLRGTGRDNTNVLGSILRIDPLGDNSVNGKYGIPADNPFLLDSGEDEIFAYGLRNPYRMSFDADTDDLYVADVGQRKIEEINIVTNGGNYGWNWKEGSFSFYNPETGSYVSGVAAPGEPNDLVDPIAEYDHDDGFSITGGYVYRGSQIPVLQGRYIFADFFRRMFYLDAGNNVLEFLGDGVSDFVAGFGQDSDNELYALTRIDSTPAGMQGKLQKIVVPGRVYSSPIAGDESAMCPPGPPGPPDESICIPIKTTNDKIATICL
jgi:glucose/arabinose dehydrogenase